MNLLLAFIIDVFANDRYPRLSPNRDYLYGEYHKLSTIAKKYKFAAGYLYLPCGEFPVWSHGVGNIHKKLGHVETICYGLHFQPKQMAVDALPIQSLQDITQNQLSLESGLNSCAQRTKSAFYKLGNFKI